MHRQHWRTGLHWHSSSLNSYPSSECRNTLGPTTPSSPTLLSLYIPSSTDPQGGRGLISCGERVNLPRGRNPPISRRTQKIAENSIPLLNGFINLSVACCYSLHTAWSYQFYWLSVSEHQNFNHVTRYKLSYKHSFLRPTICAWAQGIYVFFDCFFRLFPESRFTYYCHVTCHHFTVVNIYISNLNFNPSCCSCCMMISLCQQES